MQYSFGIRSTAHHDMVTNRVLRSWDLPLKDSALPGKSRALHLSSCVPVVFELGELFELFGSNYCGLFEDCPSHNSASSSREHPETQGVSKKRKYYRRYFSASFRHFNAQIINIFENKIRILRISLTSYTASEQRIPEYHEISENHLLNFVYKFALISSRNSGLRF